MTKSEALEIMDKNAQFWAEDAFSRNEAFSPFKSTDELGSEAPDLLMAFEALKMSVTAGLREMNEIAEMCMEELSYNRSLAAALRC